MNSNARTVRALNVATVVISGALVVFTVAMVAFLAWTGSMLNDPEVIEEIMDQMASGSTGSAFDGETYITYDYSELEGLSTADAQSLVAASMALIIGLCVAFLVCKIFALVAGIVALMATSNPQKLGLAFGLGIAAACVSGITCSFVSAVLFVISVFFIYRLRRELGPQMQPVSPVGQPAQPLQMGQSAQQPSSQQPVQPLPPVGQPVQPAQSAQPSQAPNHAEESVQQPVPAQQPGQAEESAQPAPAESASEPSSSTDPAEKE